MARYNLWYCLYIRYEIIFIDTKPKYYGYLNSFSMLTNNLKTFALFCDNVIEIHDPIHP